MRLLRGRSPVPGVLLHADDDGVELMGGDGQVGARVRVLAVVHERGEIAVGGWVKDCAVTAADVGQVGL